MQAAIRIERKITYKGLLGMIDLIEVKVRVKTIINNKLKNDLIVCNCQNEVYEEEAFTSES
tara:strand:- start:4067 stop:4249 length:183 start_codon:yes stop_codon:yes gene_type:complete